MRQRLCKTVENLPLRTLRLTSCHMRSHALTDSSLVEMDSVNYVVLASFTVRARGVKFYDIDPQTLVPGLAVILRRQPSRYDDNAVGFRVPSRRYGFGTAFLGHMEREAARFVSKLLLDPGLKTTA